MKWALAAVLLAILPVAGAFSATRVFYVRDLGLYFWPRHQWLRAAWAAGEWPWWDPYIGAGQPAVSDALNQLFLLPVTLVRLLAPEVVGFNFWIAAPFPLTAAGAWLWLRRHVSAPAAFVGASVWTLSGPMLSTGNFPNLSWSAALIPWVLWSAERIERRTGARAVALLALLVAAQALSGEPVTLAATAAVGVTYALASPRARLAWRERAAAAGRVTIGIAAGLLLAAVQLLPLADGARRSMRGHRIADNFWALHPLALLETVLPHFFGHGYHAAPDAFPWMAAINSQREPLLFSLYVGVAALGLALLHSESGELRRWRLFWWMAALAGVLCAAGRYTPFYAAAEAVVPVLRSLRFAVKYVLFAALAIAALAAAGAEALLRHARGGERLRRPLAVWTVLGLVAFTASVVPLAHALAPGVMLRGYSALARAAHLQDSLEGARWLAGPVTWLWVRLALLAAFAAALTAMAWRSPRRARLAAGALCALALADPLAINADLNPTIAPGAIGEPAWLRSTRVHPGDRVYIGGVLRAGTAHAQGARNVDAPARMNFPAEQPFTQALVTIGTQFAMAPARWRVRQVISHDLPELWPLEYRQVLVDFLTRPFEDRIRFLRRTGVRYCALPQPPRAGAAPVQSLARYFAGFDLYECHDAPRRVYVAPAARTEPDRRKQVDLLFDPAHDPSLAVVLDREAPELDGVPGAPASFPDAAIVRDRSTEVAVRASAGAGGGYLVLLDSYDPYWRVDVDGRRAELLRANVLFRAVRLAPGAHDVRFTYRPVPLFAGLSVSLAAGLVLLAACLRPKRGA